MQLDNKNIKHGTNPYTYFGINTYDNTLGVFGLDYVGI